MKGLLIRIYRSYVFLWRVFNFVFNYCCLSVNNVEWESFPTIHGRLFIRNKGKIRLGKNVVFNSSFKANPTTGFHCISITVQQNGELVVGNNTGISNSSITCLDQITIGDNVLIGGGCRITDNDSHSIFLQNRLERPEKGIKTAPVQICDGAFVGTRCIILKGVTVGKHVVVGAGSVVTRDVPDSEIWAGNPAKLISKITQETLRTEKCQGTCIEDGPNTAGGPETSE